MKKFLVALTLILTACSFNPAFAAGFSPEASANNRNSVSTSSYVRNTTTANAYTTTNSSQGQLQGQHQGQSNSATGSGNSTNVVVEGDDHKDIPVASAASTFASVCSSGASVQRNTIGFSLSASSAFCQYLSLADAYNEMGDRTEALKYVNKAAGVANRDGFYDAIRSALTLGIL